jgi:hypothetical protein
MDAHEMTDMPRMQQGNKGPRPKTATTSRKPEGIQQDHQADFRTGGHEAGCGK